MRVRGLKPRQEVRMLNAPTSHPMRVRGLKRQQLTDAIREDYVAPHAGAWIETAT